MKMKNVRSTNCSTFQAIYFDQYIIDAPRVYCSSNRARDNVATRGQTHVTSPLGYLAPRLREINIEASVLIVATRKIVRIAFADKNAHDAIYMHIVASKTCVDN